MPDTSDAHHLLFCSHNSFHSKMWTGSLSRRSDLLRAGKRHHLGHLLQAIRGQDLLQHSHGHPETFWGAYLAASLRCRILYPQSVMLQVQAADLTTRRTANWYHITRTACGELHTRKLNGSSSRCPTAHIRGVQTLADI